MPVLDPGSDCLARVVMCPAPHGVTRPAAQLWLAAVRSLHLADLNVGLAETFDEVFGLLVGTRETPTGMSS